MHTFTQVYTCITTYTCTQQHKYKHAHRNTDLSLCLWYITGTTAKNLSVSYGAITVFSFYLLLLVTLISARKQNIWNPFFCTSVVFGVKVKVASKHSLEFHHYFWFYIFCKPHDFCSSPLGFSSVWWETGPSYALAHSNAGSNYWLGTLDFYFHERNLTTINFMFQQVEPPTILQSSFSKFNLTRNQMESLIVPNIVTILITQLSTHKSTQQSPKMTK